MVRKKGLKKFNFSNKLAYTLMVVLSIALLGISVVAYQADQTAGNPPVMGHSLGEIMWPTTCTSTQVLGVNSAGDAVCVTPRDSRFTMDSRGLCYVNPSAVCTSSQATCNAYLTLQEDYGSSCDYMTPAQATTFCNSACTETRAYACDGRVSGCGGSFAMWGDIYGMCEGGGIVSCTCSTSGVTYSQAISQAAGTYCVVGTRQ